MANPILSNPVPSSSRDPSMSQKQVTSTARPSDEQVSTSHVPPPVSKLNEDSLWVDVPLELFWL